MLCAALLMQWSASLTLCLSVNGGTGISIEICTPDGLHTVSLDKDGKPIQGQRSSANACPICHGLATAVVPPSPNLSGPVRYWAEPTIATPVRTWIATPRAPPQQPRAPPLYS